MGEKNKQTKGEQIKLVILHSRIIMECKLSVEDQSETISLRVDLMLPDKRQLVLDRI